MSTTDDTEIHAIRLFTEFIATQRAGRSAAELADAMSAVLEGVRDTGKDGTLTLTLKFKKDGRMVRITDTIKTSVPEPPRDAQFYFITDDNALSTKDPDQLQFELRTVEQPTDKPIRETKKA